MKFYNSSKKLQKSDDVSIFLAKTGKNRAFVWKTNQNGMTCNFASFHPGKVVKCLNESLIFVLRCPNYINNEISIFDDVISWNWQVFFPKNRKWRHLTSRRRIFFKISGNVPFTDILILWKFQVSTVAQTEIMIDLCFLGIQRKL